MRKRKILSFVLVFAIMATAIAGSLTISYAEGTEDSPVSVPYTDKEVLFQDDFSEALDTTNSWGKPSSTLSVTEGVLAGKGYVGLVKYSGAAEWTDYMVEADVKITAEAAAALTTKSGVAAITGRSDSSGNAYEFGLVYTKETGKISARLYGRGTDPVLNQGFTVQNLSLDTSYRLSMVFAGGMIRCYINGELVYECCDISYASGVPGIYAMNIAAVYDNFKVSTVCSTPEYTDSFDYTDGMTSHSWNVAKTIEDGKMVLSSGCTYLNGIPGAVDWTDYSVEAKVAISSYSTAQVTSVAGVAGRVPTPSAGQNTSGGYELCIGYNKANTDTPTSFVRLYRRTDGTVSGAVLKSIGTVQIEKNTEYIVKMEFEGDEIRCYVNGELVITAKDTGYPAGTAGFVSSGTTILADDLKIAPYPPEPDPKPDPDPEPALPNYEDSFEDTEGTTSGDWNVKKTVENGKLVLDSGYTYLSGIPGAVDWTDYSVEAKTAITSYDTSRATPISGIAGRVPTPSNNANTSGGYEFCIGYNKANTENPESYVRLYRRTDGTVPGKVLWASNKINIEQNKEYLLKMAFEGNMIRCYVDGELVAAIEDSEYPAGTAGLVYNGAGMLIDDLKIAPYVSEPDTPDEPDVPDSGKPEFFDGFESAEDIATRGWNGKSAAVSDGRLRLEDGSCYLYNIKSAKTWDNYTVSAMVELDDSYETQTSTGVVAIAGRSTSLDDGYEFGFSLLKSTNMIRFRFYNRYNKEEKVFTSYDIQPNFPYKLSMVFKDDTIKCYFGDTLVLEYDIPDGCGLTGAPGVRSGNAVGYFDNFTVTQKEAGGSDKEYTEPETEIWYQDNFNSESMLSDRGWNTDSVVIMNGKAYFGEIASSMYLLGHEGSQVWKNYAVEADVTVTEKDFSANLLTGTVSIAARSKGPQTGYEFGLLFLNSGGCQARIYDRTSKQALKTVSGINATLGDTVHMKMIVKDNMIYGFVDNVLVISAEADTCAAGTIGLMATKYAAEFDNVVVRKITAADFAEVTDSPGSAGNATSPKTGDDSYTGIFLLVLFTGSIILIVTTGNLFKRRKQSNVV